MEAALRTAYELVTGKTLEDVNFTAVRGMEGIKEATVKIGDHGREAWLWLHAPARPAKLLDAVKRGEKQYTLHRGHGLPRRLRQRRRPAHRARPPCANWTNVPARAARQGAL